MTAVGFIDGRSLRNGWGSLKSGLVLAVRGGLTLLGLAVVAVKTSVDANWWHPSAAVFSALVFANAGLSAADNGWTTWRRKRHDLAQKARADFEKTAITAIFKIVDLEKSLDARQIGMNIFRVCRRRAWKIIPREEHLERVHRYRFPGGTQPSKVAWVAGKGAIGQAWRLGKTFHADRRKIATRWVDKVISDAEWNRIESRNDNQGMTRKEFQEVVGKYDEIVAVPVKDPTGKVLGVIAFDLKHDPAWPSKGPCRFDKDRVEEVAHATLEVIRSLL